jgi:hypothetical protein
MAALCMQLVAKQECDAVLVSLQKQLARCQAHRPSGEERLAMAMFVWQGHFDEELSEEDFDLRVWRPLCDLVCRLMQTQKGWLYPQQLQEAAGTYLALSACSREVRAALRVQLRARICALFQQIARAEIRHLTQRHRF